MASASGALPDLADFESEEEKERLFMRMTPLEVDLQLQAAELVFRSILQGKSVGVCYPEDLTEWQREVLGDEWVVKNKQQRREVTRQMNAEGENTPMWMEALAHMGEIAWEVLEAGYSGERVRTLSQINRQEIIEQFKELEPKVRISQFARCGAGDKMHGLRACIAILRLFVEDPEVLDWCSKCLLLIISDNRYNRDGLAELSMPMPPNERAADAEETGWSFLYAALHAFVTQATNNPDLPVAAQLAACLVQTRRAPAMELQLRALGEETPEDAQEERKALKEMLPQARTCVQDMFDKYPHKQEFAELAILLQVPAEVR
eukprot:CAMPEP_0178389228 /NCGR_PEP_ID=MMETSP0689_2-20121128/10003_1 /TAXON_ID=160604 /ORGANISM="Amphidinium massartii, Strain CS-259" /LENGTH=318 /DNA_ID=CAMNT_0020009661 /DNA_START=22 /DNA_END=978 /DNA_ORIENTATION=+